MKTKTVITLLICIGFPMLLGAVAGITTSANIHDWYIFLNKPSFNPPNSVFAPVWTCLYFLMGISSYLIWKSPRSPQRTKALSIFVAQLALNFLWSFLFFYFHMLAWALFDIVLIWLSVLAMIFLFARVNKAAALLQIPYILWLSFAGLLNASIWFLN